VLAVCTASSRADAALGGGELSLHGFGQRERRGERADHHHELVDRTVVIDVEEVASLDLLVSDARVEDESMVRSEP
jgi:hypothetical protein